MLQPNFFDFLFDFIDGKLTGSGCIDEFANNGMEVARTALCEPSRVGGVGKGSQSCNEDVVVPLAVARTNG